jgi:cell division protein FtsB
MFDFYQRRKIKSFLTMPITRVILLILALWMCWGAYTRYEKAELVKVRRVETEQELEHLKKQKEALEKQVKYLSDDRGIEAEMRRQYDVTLPGEQVVVIVDPQKATTSSASTSKAVEEDVPWYLFWR